MRQFTKPPTQAGEARRKNNTGRQPDELRQAANEGRRFNVTVQPVPLGKRTRRDEGSINLQGRWWAIFCLAGATLCSFVLVRQTGAILSWTATFGLLLLVARRWDRASHQGGRLLRLLIISYVALSFIGMLEVSDNFRNFGTLFGKGADDSEFFVDTLSILRDQTIPNRAGFYHAVLAVWGFLPTLVWREATNALEFLPLNWALGAVVVGLCDDLCYVVTKKRPPFWLLILTLLGNYRFTDALIHLYRDGLILVFLLLALTSVLRSRTSWSVVYSVPLLLLRGANFLLYFVVLVVSTTFRWTRSRAILYGGAICIFSAGIWFLPSFGTQLFRYATAFKTVGYGQDWVASSVDDHIAFRASMVAAQVVQDSTLRSAVADNGTTAMVLRPITFVLFPIRCWPLFMSADTASRFAANSHVDRGLTLMNVYVWFSVACWVVVVPLVTVGLGTALCGPRNHNLMGIYYLISLALVSFVSFQMRHSLSFIVIHPLLAMLGYLTCRIHYIWLAVVVGILTVGCIVAYNAFTGSLL